MTDAELDQKLAEIQERRGAITPGPWDVRPGSVATARVYSDSGYAIAECFTGMMHFDPVAHATFFAHAPEDIDILLSEVARLRAPVSLTEQVFAVTTFDVEAYTLAMHGLTGD